MCQRRRFDLALTGKIAAIHRRSRGVYGSPNIHAELADDHDIRVGRKRVARLMRAAGLKGATLRRYVITTQPDAKADKAIDLVQRRFYATAPDRLWVADITYIPTWSGFVYLAIMLDVFSRVVLPHVILLPDASRAMLPAEDWCALIRSCEEGSPSPAMSR
jgi:putative transposase